MKFCKLECSATQTLHDIASDQITNSSRIIGQLFQCIHLTSATDPVLSMETTVLIRTMCDQASARSHIATTIRLQIQSSGLVRLQRTQVRSQTKTLSSLDSSGRLSAMRKMEKSSFFKTLSRLWLRLHQISVQRQSVSVVPSPLSHSGHC